MDFIVYFLVLLFQIDPAFPDCTVDNCIPNYCSGNDCSQCLAGVYESSTNGKCYECNLYCRNCHGECYNCASSSCPAAMCRYANCPLVACTASRNIYCSNCPDGFYKDRGYCFRCLHPNCKCSHYDDCIECLPGKYGPNFCNNNCPSNCTLCSSSADCAECITGTYGHACQFGCISTCQDGTCDTETGTCLHECPVGQYLYAENDCRTCPSACESCKNETLCTKCKDGYWGSLCNKTCGSGCTTDACDQSQGCRSGCKYGYYHLSQSNTYTCVECPQHCKICLVPNKCNECEKDFYLKNASACVACSVHCKNASCGKTNGSCTDGCLGNTTGHRCEERCFSNCLECSQFNASDCSVCEKGFYGPSCERECSSNCNLIHLTGNQACEKKNGHCIDGCKNSYWGPHCDKICEEGCIGNICSKTTGECLFGCKTTYHGTNCETECSQTCYSLGQGVRVCDNVKGSCVAGCVVGFSGPYCNTTTGSTESSQPDKLDNTNTSAITGLSVVVGIALLLLTVSVIYNVMLLRKWRASSPQNSDPRPRQRELSSTDYEDLNRNNHESSTYSNITRDYENTNI